MSACSVCGDNHMSMACTELYSEIKPLKDPKPTGPRGQDEDDAVALLQTGAYRMTRVTSSGKTEMISARTTVFCEDT